MVYLKLLKTVLSLPIYLLLALVRYFIVGGKFRKYRNSLRETLTLELVERFFLVGVKEYGTVMRYGGERLLKTSPLLGKFPKSQFSGYGQRYDDNSLWLVKNGIETKSNPVIIYLHGGGYFAQTVFSQIAGVLAVHKLLNPEIKKKTSILYLDYKLASHGYRVPYQTKQLIETYSKLVAEGHTNLILLGDSAGGNMILQFLQNLKISTNSVYPKNVLLLSPWVNLQARPEQFQINQSYYDNRNKDYLKHSAFSDKKNFLNHLLKPEDLKDIKINPGKEPLNKSDWTNIPTFNNEGYHIFVLAGEDEVFRDDILNFAKVILGSPITKIKESNGKFDRLTYSYIRNEPGKPSLKVFVEPWGIHDAALVMEHKIWSELKDDSELKWINPDKYFGLVKITEHLNDTL